MCRLMLSQRTAGALAGRNARQTLPTMLKSAASKPLQTGARNRSRTACQHRKLKPMRLHTPPIFLNNGLFRHEKGPAQRRRPWGVVCVERRYYGEAGAQLPGAREVTITCTPSISAKRPSIERSAF